MIGKYWEHFTHSGDIGLRGIGATIEEAFEQIAIAMTAAITDPKTIVPLEEVEIDCEGPDDERLLAEWLNALFHQMATKRMLFSHFDVEINANRLRATAWGEGVDRHIPVVEVNGAARTNLRVRQDETGTWLAQCVVAM